jgi:HEAT repeat protein
MVLDLVALLDSSDISVRVDAVGELVKQPEAARAALVEVLMDAATSTRTRIWAMIAVAQLDDVRDPTVSHALVHCLRFPEAVVRRSAAEMLGFMKVESAVPHIATLLTDHEPIDSAWFDDDATPSLAAVRALEAIASSEALALLARHRNT